MKFRPLITFLLIFLILSINFNVNSLKVNKIDKTTNILEKQTSEGYILFAPIFSKKTYLIDKNGQVVHSWSSKYYPADSVYLKNNGNIVRTERIFTHPRFLIIRLGTGGILQEIAPNGSIVWNYKYIGKDYVPHHDIHVLPNGNILILAWEIKSYRDIISAGKDPKNLKHHVIWTEYLIEVEPIYPEGGNIVWEWHVWDHLIQDYDPSKDNYGVVENHPELIDINFGKNNQFWTHADSIDYNEKLDQILISVNNFNEIWIIDHNTTMREAKGHSGGKNGKGGDIIYRWGNPQSYRAGDEDDQQFYGQHDAHWIEQGCPGEGNILVFNNGESRPGDLYSSIDEIVPPIDTYGNYNYIPGQAFGPDKPIWRYTSRNPTDFYCSFSGCSQRLSTGNTLICDGFIGYFFEITPDKEKVWEYTNTFPLRFINTVYLMHLYPSNHPGIKNLFNSSEN